MQALRPLSISAALDLVLAHPQCKVTSMRHRSAIRCEHGGETMLLLGGAA